MADSFSTRLLNWLTSLASGLAAPRGGPPTHTDGPTRAPRRRSVIAPWTVAAQISKWENLFMISPKNMLTMAAFLPKRKRCINVPCHEIADWWFSQSRSMIRACSCNNTDLHRGGRNAAENLDATDEWDQILLAYCPTIPIFLRFLHLEDESKYPPALHHVTAITVFNGLCHKNSPQSESKNIHVHFFSQFPFLEVNGGFLKGFFWLDT